MGRYNTTPPLPQSGDHVSYTTREDPELTTTGTHRQPDTNSINAELPGRCRFITGYLRMLLGGVVTFFIQSSSLFTCTLTPMVGLGIVTLETMYPLTLGANLGTTFTGILAALTSDPASLGKALQISLCHLFFNISGVLLFYPVPLLRRVPIR